MAMKRRAALRAIVLVAEVAEAELGTEDAVKAIARSGRFRIRTSAGTQTRSPVVSNRVVLNPVVSNRVQTGLLASVRSARRPIRTLPRRVACGTVATCRRKRHPVVTMRPALPAGRDAAASAR